MVTSAVIGRERETELLTAALDAGAHVVLEGPPGTGKSTLLRAVATTRDVPFFLVEGNAELTPARLVGHFDPSLVLAKGYRPDIFVDGPLVAALREGGLLYVEEINRVPEETLNVLITVMSEGELNVPRLGVIPAGAGFRLIAAMNPYDAVGTARISSAIYDRTCRIAMGYQSSATESAIVAQRDGVADPAWRDSVVELVRKTRAHPDIRVGSSVRGAIDMVGVTARLGESRAVPVTDWRAGLDAAMVSLSGRVRLLESCARTPEDVVRELYESVFGREPAATPEGIRRGKPEPAGTAAGGLALPEPSSQQRRSQPKDRTTGRSELSRHPGFAELSPEVGKVDEDALARQLEADPDATLALLADMTTATDEILRARARKLAARVVLDRTRIGRSVVRGTGRPRLVPASRGGDLDLDASLDVVVGARAEQRPPHLDDMLARDWGAPSLALCLLVDDSGSMTGARLAASAMVTAACAFRAPVEHAVLAFARDVRPIRRLTGTASAETVVDRVLRLRGHGVTGLAGALSAAGEALASARAQRRVVVLLSDCRATDDRDPVPAASSLPELIVLAPRDDTDEAAAFAVATGAKWAPLDSVDRAVRTLNELLT